MKKNGMKKPNHCRTMVIVACVVVVGLGIIAKNIYSDTASSLYSMGQMGMARVQAVKRPVMPSMPSMQQTQPTMTPQEELANLKEQLKTTTDKQMKADIRARIKELEKQLKAQKQSIRPMVRS